MDELDLPTRYRSFAPTLTFHVTPWRKGPYFTLNYEQSFKNIAGSNLAYGRFEFDVSHKLKLDRLRLINLKGGFGFYTNTETSYFLDYTNFRDHNLPGGWEDDWTGNFQLLNSTWYNTSRYYYRVNTSYESPCSSAHSCRLSVSLLKTRESISASCPSSIPVPISRSDMV